MLLTLCLLLALQDKPGPMFQQVIGSATGENGYEEFVLAAEMVQSNREYQAAMEADVLTLKQKRAVVVATRKPIEIMRAGLLKKSFQPRKNMDVETLLPEFAAFRALARALQIHQYVHLADGQIAKAIEDFRDGCRFAQAIQEKILIAGLVGIAIEAISLRSMALHLDQLDYSDCGLLIQAVSGLVNRPDPFISAIDSELQMLHKILADPAMFSSTVLTLDETDDPDHKAVIERLQSEPALLAQTLHSADAILGEYYTRVKADLEKPYWERSNAEFSAPQADTFTQTVAEMLVPTFTQVLERSTRMEAQLRLLGVHAAVLQHRWWYDQLPAKLEVLKLGDLAIDPFSGKPFVYKIEPTGYRLYSVGANMSDDGGKPSGDGDVFVLTDGSR